MVSRPVFVIDDFVRARNAFDDGRGPAEAWAQMNGISLWRLDEVAEQAGTRAWSMLFAPVEPGPDHDGVPQLLRHAVRSAGLGSLSLPAVWRLSTDRVAVSRVLVVFGIDKHRAVRFARRYEQVAVVFAQRVPYEDVFVLNVADEQRIQLPRFEPAAIAGALTRMCGMDAVAVAVAYRPSSFGESQLMSHAERRLRSQEE